MGENINFNKNHPERREGEVWIGNFEDNSIDIWPWGTEYKKIGWKTKRKGNVPYDTNGKPLEKRVSAIFPVFVQQSEIAVENPEILRELLPEKV